jgi:hypothetical protein
MNEPPTELGQCLLKLFRAYRREMEELLVFQMVTDARNVKTSHVEFQGMRESVQPLLVRTFGKAEEELLAGKDPLATLKDFLKKLA